MGDDLKEVFTDILKTKENESEVTQILCLERQTGAQWV